MALPARRFQVTCGKDRFLPGARGVMRLGHLSRRTLSAMTNHTAPVFYVVGDWRVRAKWLGDRRCVLQGLLGHGQMTGSAPINHGEFGQPDLLDSRSEMMLQRGAIRTGGNKFLVLALVMSPLIEEILSRGNGKRDQQQQAGPAKTMNRRREDIPTQPFGDPFAQRWCAQELLQGHTQTQPGPRKSAPTVVRITASIKNQVMIQKESGFALSQF